jgi:2'-5' RNA ligase
MPERETPYRVFVAVDLSDEARAVLAAHLEHHAAELPGSVIPPENWHLTLRFLGKVDAVGLDTVTAALDQADLGGSFRLSFAGLGAFPRPNRATVLWVGIDAGAEEITALAERVEAALDDAGFMPEERPFHPHLTLARIRPHRDVRRLIASVPTVPLRLDVEEVVLFESHLGGNRKAVYEPRERFPLG